MAGDEPVVIVRPLVNVENDVRGVERRAVLDARMQKLVDSGYYAIVGHLPPRRRLPPAVAPTAVATVEPAADPELEEPTAKPRRARRPRKVAEHRSPLELTASNDSDDGGDGDGDQGQSQHQPEPDPA